MSTSFLSITPMSVDILANGAISGKTEPEKLKAACKAIESLFASQLLSEIGKGIDGDKADATSGQYSDFIQQALSSQVTKGGGFGLASMLEKALTPAVHSPLHVLHTHVSTTPTTAK